MISRSKDRTILLAPAPRQVSEIFDDTDLQRLSALGPIYEATQSEIAEEWFARVAPNVEVAIGQIDLPQERLRRMTNLKAIFNVEGNFLPNIDYEYCFRHGIRVLNISPVFAEPVAEAALGMAIDLARGISRSDRRFRQGGEQYGMAANHDAFSLYQQPVGFIGMGDLGRAIVPLLKPFGCKVRAYDPWLPGAYLESLGCQPASLDDVLAESQVVFVVAGVTSQNEGSLGAAQFALMRPGAAFILLSRAGIVDFDSMLDAAKSGHLKVATDVFPLEPLPATHRARNIDGVLLSPHQAGALGSVLKQIGRFVVEDTELIWQGLPPVLCKPAQLETVALLRSKPVAHS